MRIQPAACRFRNEKCNSTAKAKTAPTAITMSAVAVFMKVPPRLCRRGHPAPTGGEMPGYRNPNMQASNGSDKSRSAHILARPSSHAAALTWPPAPRRPAPPRSRGRGRRVAARRPRAGDRILRRQRPGDVLQALPLGLDPEDDLDQPG